jgi:hypothetical protein
MSAENSSWTNRAGQIGGLIVGGVIGNYSGINLVIPAVIAAGAWWIGKKKMRPAKLSYLPAIAVQTGHLMWIFLGIVMIGALGLALVDVVVLLIGITWLVLKPSIGPLIFLTLFQALAFAMNVITIAEVAVGSNPHKALVVHLILRVLAVFYMWSAYGQSRNAVAETAVEKT